MNMGVLVHADRAMGQGSQREIPIPKKKWIKDYFTLGLGKSLLYIFLPINAHMPATATTIIYL